MRKAITGLVVALLAAVALVAISSPAMAGDKVNICHRDQGSPEYKIIEISVNAKDAHLAHPWGPDIYPVPDGGCPQPEISTQYREKNVDCDGWELWGKDFVGDDPVSEAYLVASGEWSKPFELESVSFDFTEIVIHEPENCLVRIVVETDCEGWFVYRTDQDGVLDSGQWTEPFALEQATSKFVDFIIFEPEDCPLQEGEVIVGVALSCSKDEGGVVYQADFGVFISPSGGATVKFNGQEFTESGGGHIAFGSYDWSAEAAEGFTISGDDSGTVKLTSEDCNGPERPPSTGGAGDLFSDPLVLAGVGTLGLAAIGAGAYGLRRRNQSVV